MLAAEMPEGIEQMYAHFLHTPASVTRYAALINNLPWSCSAHAKDIWTSEEWDLREKLQELQWLATCTGANHEYLQSISDDPSKVQLVYHGLDFERFDTVERESRAAFDASGEDKTVQIISVGRAVPKKGYDDLLKAFAKLALDERNSNETFLALALRVGFNSKTTFNRAFKKVTGTTPRAYLKEQKEKIH